MTATARHPTVTSWPCVSACAATHRLARHGLSSRFSRACVCCRGQVCVVTTGTGRHFCDLAAGYDPTGFAEFEALGVSVYTDSDEWEGYRVIKSDPVLHVEVRCGA